MSEAVFHRLDYDRVLRWLREHATATLAARPEVREVILIGSLARGDWSAGSDADLVILVDRDDERGPFRGPRYLPAGGIGVGVDALVYTPEEARAWSPRFRAEVARGIVLYRRADLEGAPADG